MALLKDLWGYERKVHGVSMKTLVKKLHLSQTIVIYASILAFVTFVCLWIFSGWQAAKDELIIVSVALFTIGCCYVWFRVLSPMQIDNEKQEKIESLKKEIKEITEVSLKIEHKENDPDYYDESVYIAYRTGPHGMNYIGDYQEKDRDKSSRLCRISIYNSSKTKPLNNVKIKLISIEPIDLQGKLPLQLHSTIDLLNIDDPQFIDVVQWEQIGEDEPYYTIQTSNENDDTKFSVYDIKLSDTMNSGKFPIAERGKVIDYKIKIRVTSKNSISTEKYFNFGMRKKNNDKEEKLYMWSAN